ncbi:dienelactone hydrolase family protein [Gordonia sp. DT30]|uniref:dienelactone hydrolase family protein n=1 Tax=unclassified Gordonia (in: high G+C Gram-positive bacteria) TaxID=2657482 RepID=UPI003CF219F3
MPGKKRPSKPSQPSAKQFKALTRRGPHRVLAGNLGIVGIEGRVFTPAEGTRLPAIAFGHAWRCGGSRYRDLAYHLASWGFVVAVPDGHRGLAPSDSGLAAEMRSALSVVAHAPLGDGQITVDPSKAGFVGHGFGAAAAVIAASDEPLLGQPSLPARGVVAVFPAPSTALLPAAAAQVRAPGLILAAGTELDTFDANARPLAQTYGGDVVLRTLPAATSRGLLERRTWKSMVGVNGADKTTHRQVRALVTGFLLYTVAGDDDHAGFADPAAVIEKSVIVDPTEQPEHELDHISRLLGAKPREQRGRIARRIPVP